MSPLRMAVTNVTTSSDVSSGDPIGFYLPQNEEIQGKIEEAPANGEDDQPFERDRQPLATPISSNEYLSSKFKAVYAILKEVPVGEKTVIFVSRPHSALMLS